MSLLLLFNQSAAVTIPPEPVLPPPVVEFAIAGGPGWKAEKGSYWEALLKPPRSIEKAQPIAEQDAVKRIAPPPAAIAKPNQIAIAATEASRQAMQRSVQAAAKAAQQQALNELHQAMLTQQAAMAQLQMNDDDEDALLALLLA